MLKIKFQNTCSIRITIIITIFIFYNIITYCIINKKMLLKKVIFFVLGPIFVKASGKNPIVEMLLSIWFVS